MVYRFGRYTDPVNREVADLRERVHYAEGTAETVLALAEIALNELDEARKIIEAFVAQEVDYMTRNALSDPEQQHNVKWARGWLARRSGDIHDAH